MIVTDIFDLYSRIVALSNSADIIGFFVELIRICSKKSENLCSPSAQANSEPIMESFA